MDRIDRERFGRLRHHLAKPTHDAAWRNALCFMLLRAAREHPEMYQSMWVPYLSSVRGMWETPLRLLGSMEDVHTWCEVAPFALFNVELSSRRARDRMHALCHMPVALRIKTLNLERNAFRPKHMKQLALAPHLYRVRRLVLSHNKLALEDVEQLLNSPAFENLQEIQLDANIFTFSPDRFAFEQAFSRGGSLSFEWR